MPDLTRVVVAATGRIKANFSDGTILVLSPSGRAFSVLQDGHHQRQLSDFVLSRHAAYLAVVLEFRNMHVDVPCYCARLASQAAPRDGLKLGFRMDDLWWPADAGEALAKGLVADLADGKVSLSTEDDAGRLVLHSHRRRFAVCYPVLVAELHAEGQYEYAWQTQVFSLQAFPDRWAPAVELLLDAVHELDARRAGGNDGDDGDGSGSPGEAGAGPGEGPCEGRDGSHALATTSGCGGGGARRTPLPSALPPCGATGFQDSAPADGWWAEQTLSLFADGELVALEWTPQATYQFQPGAREVEVWVHADESCLATTQGGRFLAHARPSSSSDPSRPSTEQLYAASCVPESVWVHERGERYALAPLAAHAGKLRAQMAHLATSAPHGGSASEAPPQPTFCITGGPLPHHGGCGGGAHARAGPPRGPGVLGLLPSSVEETFAVESELILDESHVPEQGSFTAYADGRLRARFLDRTILHMNGARSHAKLILPDGSSTLVSTSTPIGVEAYLRDALAYAAWAFASPEDVAHRASVQARVASELSSMTRMGKMLEWAAAKKVAGGGGNGAPLLELTNLPGGGGGGGAGGFSLEDVNAMLWRNQMLLQTL
ncbi:hypothetical protein FOA52_015554 [Chlamydomonas sp. UWO 241]|nr:hypothetical protein FOA52_015554 [Chlamydomonas sp. UWO 241]